MATNKLWADNNNARLAGSCVHLDGVRTPWVNAVGAALSRQLGCQSRGAVQRPANMYLVDNDPLYTQAESPCADFSDGRVVYYHLETDNP